MVNKCTALGCSSGYKRKQQNTDDEDGSYKITFHSFSLHDKELCQKLVRANNRKDYVPTKHSKLCSLHFKPCDFVDIHKDTNKRRDKTRATKTLCKVCERRRRSVDFFKMPRSIWRLQAVDIVTTATTRSGHESRCSSWSRVLWLKMTLLMLASQTSQRAQHGLSIV